MHHWRSILDISILDVKYEDLVANSESKIRELITFSGLSWNDRCLRFYETKRFVDTSSYQQVRQPITDRSVGRWRNYAKYLDPLRTALGEL
jgi:hypothetical protein